MTNEQAFKRMKEMMDLRGFAPSTQRTYLMHINISPTIFQHHFAIWDMIT